MNLKPYKSIFDEAIPLSKVKPFIKGKSKYKKYKDRLKDWFDGKYRVYVKLKKSEEIGLDIEDSLEEEIEKALQNTNFELKDFKNGLAFDKKNKREIKLGKVLNKVSKDLLDRFNSTSSRVGKNIENPIMVISRHPYDILGQSYDRGWTSCKELGRGVKQSYLKDEIFQVLVAYLIYPDDKNIKKPIARVLALPYFNKDKDLAYIVHFNIYGDAGDWKRDFISGFEKWIDEKQGKKSGIYNISPKIYKDDMDSEIALGQSLYDRIVDGVWKGGTWRNETWRNGIWEDGTWESGTWKNGIWEKGTWERGTWETGTWYFGYWETGIWETGTWKSGIWKSGIWKNGIWEKGTWGDGIWEKGIWHNGIWMRGIWKDGIWLHNSKIYDPNKLGKFKSDWKWNGNYVNSPVSPKEYFGTEKSPYKGDI